MTEQLLAAAGLLAPDATPVVSRASGPELLRLAAALPAHLVAPTLRGVTVWSAVETVGPTVAVVEDPNWLGCAEARPAGPFVARLAAEPGEWAARSRAARKLAGTLRQIPGVWTLPAGSAPWFAVGTPTSGERIARHAAAAGLEGVTALGDRFPDVPGGIRVAPPHPLPAAWVEACVASVRRAIVEGSS